MPKFDSLNVSTIREFDGGWDAVSSDLNMSTKYSKVENNVFYGISGAKQKRYGTKYFVDVTKYTELEETYENVVIEVNQFVKFAQDTVHNVEKGDTITIASPASIAGSYTVTNNYYSKFTVIIANPPADKTFTDVQYTCNGITQTAATVGIIGNTMTFDRNINPLVKKGDEISVTSPAEYVGDWTVTYADSTTIEIDCEQSSATTATSIQYTLSRNGTIYTKAGDISEQPVKKLMVFEYTAQNGNELLIGHKVTITDPASLAGTYTVVERDFEKYKVNVSDTAATAGTLSEVTITHNNRNISGTRIVDMTYFLDKIIAVTDYGEVIAIDASGNASILFNEDIANQTNTTQPGGWIHTTKYPVDSVCFTVFNGILTIWNEWNKPLYVNLYNVIPCNYLVDEATQTNSMIPIAKYAIAINHYMVVGNTIEDGFQTGEEVRHKDRIYISDYDTIATFNDGSVDYLENGGIYVDIGKVVSTSMSEIKGLSRYRTQLIVGFDEVSAFGTLGTMIDATTNDGIEYQLHKPEFSDVISDFGCISNRTYQTILGDVACLSYDGVGLFRKQVLSSLTTSAKLSTIIGPELYKTFKDLTQDSLTNRIWTVYNPKEQQYMLFIPNGSTLEETTETLCFVYTIPSTASQTKATTGAWSLFTGWNFQCGCTSALNEVFFANGNIIYVLGNADRPIFSDFQDDPDYPADEETGISGKDITFDWEFGWQDFNNRVAKKTLRYIGVTSTGTSNYTFGTWYDYLKDPECEMHIDLVGGDAAGWGNGRQRYGGGRRTSTEELFAYTAKFNLTKLRIYGSSKEDLKISAISLFYLVGNIRR